LSILFGNVIRRYTKRCSEGCRYRRHFGSEISISYWYRQRRCRHTSTVQVRV